MLLRKNCKYFAFFLFKILARKRTWRMSDLLYTDKIALCLQKHMREL